jgi:SanA protein
VALAAIATPAAWIEQGAKGGVFSTAEMVPRRDVAIVPGATVVAGQPGWSLTDRLTAALSLYRSGRVKRILISGLDTKEQPEVPVMYRWLKDRGMPEGDLLVDEAGARTVHTMWNAASRFRVDDAVVCTQSLYMARALFLARQAGIDAVGLALETPLRNTSRAVGTEALKSALAFIEGHLRPLPDHDGGRAALAAR